MSIYTTKYCIKCETEKSTTSFSKCKSNKDGLQSKCKQCCTEYNKIYRSDHVEHFKAYDKEYSKKYYLANIDSRKQSMKEYQVDNKEIINAIEAKRRAAKLNAIPKWSELNLIKRLYKECKLLSKETGIQYHVDHIIPLQSNIVCGLHCIANLQIISATENLSKSNSYWSDMP